MLKLRLQLAFADRSGVGHAAGGVLIELCLSEIQLQLALSPSFSCNSGMA